MHPSRIQDSVPAGPTEVARMNESADAWFAEHQKTRRVLYVPSMTDEEYAETGLSVKMRFEVVKIARNGVTTFKSISENYVQCKCGRFQGCSKCGKYQPRD